MAGDWIKMRGNLWDDPRVGGLCDATDQPEAMIVGALYWLWAMADQHSEEGELPGLTLRAIDRKTGVAGFAQALCNIGWLESSADGVRIPGFDQHNGASAKKRCQTAQRVAKHKAGNAEVTHQSEEGNAPSVSETTEVRYLEKEIEKEKKEIPSVPNGTDAASASAPKVQKSPEDQAKADLWAAAVAVLKAGGCDSEPVARSFMGKLVKDYGLDAVRESVAAAATAQPADAREYLKATCQRAKGERKDPVTVIENPQLAATKQALAADREREKRLSDPEEQARIAAAMAKARERITRVA